MACDFTAIKPPAWLMGEHIDRRRRRCQHPILLKKNSPVDIGAGGYSDIGVDNRGAGIAQLSRQT